MARRRRNRRPIEKALPATLSSSAVSGQTYTAEQVSALLNRQQSTASLAQPLPRDQYEYQFGPGIPLTPAPLDPTRPTGRAEPRIWEYPVSWNLPGQRGRLVPWKTLRDAADLPLIRDCIRIRKSEIQGLEWDFGLTRRALDRAQRDQPEAGRLDVERQLRDKLVTDIDRCTDFWLVPDPGNGYTFAEWICMFLEEQLVLDALAIYPRYTLGGDLYALEILDSSTIKPLLDHRGGRPMPPEPAYQQILYGFPRGEFTADTSDTEGRTVVPNAYTSDQLVYIRREVRAHTPYGLSPVEQALLDIDLWQKRVAWLRAEYTDGTMPSGWLVNEQGANHQWNPSQVAEYERELNDHYSGNTSNRFRYRVLPPGFRPEESGPGTAEKYKSEFDLHLLKLVVAHFDLTVHELGFTEAKGLGSQGHAEGQDRLNNRKGRKPVLRWIAELITDMSRAHLGLPAELEFKWLGIDDEGEGEEEDKTAEQVAAGLLTINEGRDELGRPRFTIPEADKPAIIAASGTITFVEGAEERAQATQDLAERAVDAKANGGPPGGGQDNPRAPARSGSSAPGGSGAKKHAEALAYKRWAAKGRNGRRFELEHIEPADLLEFEIDPARVTHGGGDQGKALWPGWGPDQDLVARFTGEIRDAVLGAVDTAVLAAGLYAWWQTQQPVDGQDPGQTEGVQHPVADAVLAGALAWLTARMLASLTGALTGPLRELWSLAWELGETSARHTLGEHDGPATPMPDTLSAGEIESIARGYVERSVGALADAPTGADELERGITAVLDDESAAERIATTTTAEQVSAASQAAYERNGIVAKRWAIAPDQRVCPICQANSDQGSVPIDGVFASGVPYPPGHPRCRCALMPVLDSDAEKAAPTRTERPS